MGGREGVRKEGAQLAPMQGVSGWFQGQCSGETGSGTAVSVSSLLSQSSAELTYRFCTWAEQPDPCLYTQEQRRLPSWVSWSMSAGTLRAGRPGLGASPTD